MVFIYFFISLVKERGSFLGQSLKKKKVLNINFNQVKFLQKVLIQFSFTLYSSHGLEHSLRTLNV